MAMSQSFIVTGWILFNRRPRAAAAEKPPADLRDAAHVPPVQAALPADLVQRLRAADGNAPIARNLILEAASEIDRLRAAIRTHRDEVWGADTPDHISDCALYRSVDPA